MRKKEPSQEVFDKDVADHVMTIEHDSGVHRCIHFGKPGSSNRSFRIVTMPGSLVYTGDMGTYVFERLRDMFEFFRRGERGEINPQYWAEKVKAAERHGAIEEFDEELWEAAVRDAVKDYLEGFYEEVYEGEEGETSGEWMRQARAIWPEVKDKILSHGASNTHEAMDATARVEIEDADGEDVGSRIFQDFYERNVESYSWRYIWCCRALVWAIDKYDMAKTEAEVTA